jgi:hypothetical protein
MNRMQVPDGLEGCLGGFHWTAINVPHTCLMSSRLQWRSMKWRHKLEIFSRQKPGTHEYTAPGGLPTELCIVVPTIWGSWVQNLVHVIHLAATFMETLCTPGVASCWRTVALYFWGSQNRSQAVCTKNAFLDHWLFDTVLLCITVNIPPGALARRNANPVFI